MDKKETTEKLLKMFANNIKKIEHLLKFEKDVDYVKLYTILKDENNKNIENIKKKFPELIF